MRKRKSQKLLHRILSTAGILLLAGGSILLGIAGFDLWQAYAFQNRASHQLNSLLDSVDPASHNFKPEIPSFPARLEIPRLKLIVMIDNGIEPRSLKRGAGWIPATARPGESGNTGIAGHRNSFFRPLKDIRHGDLIELVTPAGSFQYQVKWIRIVEPGAVKVLAPTEEDSVTLVTCYPFYYIGDAPQRFIVRANRVQNSEAKIQNSE